MSHGYDMTSHINEMISQNYEISGRNDATKTELK